MLAKLNGKISTGLKTISLRSDSFNIRFDSFSNKSIVTMSHGVSIKMEGSDLAMLKEFKNEWNYVWVYTHRILVYDEYETT